jgi:hypothetical protein
MTTTHQTTARLTILRAIGGLLGVSAALGITAASIAYLIMTRVYREQ